MQTHAPNFLAASDGTIRPVVASGTFPKRAAPLGIVGYAPPWMADFQADEADVEASFARIFGAGR